VNALFSPLLASGIYTIPEAARLVEAPKGAMRVWVEGRKGKQSPIIENQLGRIGRTVAVSFTNLMELRFVATFARAGVRLDEIRSILGEVRKELRHPHPFATKTVFKTDGRRIVAEIALKNGVEVLYDLKSRNYEMLPVILQSLKENVIWSADGDAIAWFPRPKVAPHVLIHPAHSFGRPILSASKIPVETLADAVVAEGSVRAVAQLYDVPEKHVRERLAFSDRLESRVR
jgi:uncharacterized protein (DUF433 family)